MLIVPFYVGEIMDEILSSYMLAFDEINKLTVYSYMIAQDDENKVKKVTDDVLSFLINAYGLGITNASKMLDIDIPIDSNSMLEAIYVLIDNKTFEDRIAEHMVNNDLKGLEVLVESEYHRVYNTAVKDGGIYYQDNVAPGVKKTWYTVGDNKVRETHRYLERQTVNVDEDFYTYDGDYAPYPGGFSKPENNVNCRCTMALSAAL